MCENWRQRGKSGNLGSRGGLHSRFHLFSPVSDDNGSSAPEVEIPPRQHTWFWMAWSVEFCMR